MSRSDPRPVSLDLRLLGPFRAFVDGVEIEERRWPRRKPRQLVTLLALQPHHQLHREQVMDLLWTDLGPDSAVNSLHKTIYQARRALEPALGRRASSRFIHTREQHVLLRAPGELRVDAEHFERHATEALSAGAADLCAAALTLYTGDLLPEDPYEDWIVARREHLRLLFQSLLERIARHSAEHGDYERSAGQLLELLASDPLNETAHRRLMLLYALAGNRHKALLQYRRCGETLLRELGVEPEPETEALYQQILHERIQPVAPAPAVASSGAVDAPAPDAPRPAAPPGNLPSEATSFVGRTWAIGEVRRALHGARVLTLAGTGGIGKTRLALRVADDEAARFPDGVWFVDLAPVSDGALVWQTLGTSVGVRETEGRSLRDRLLDWIRPRRVLLVWDNCEHLVAECARAIAALLEAGPHARVIATSREALSLAGERVWQVQPLSLPAPDQTQFPSTVMEFEASRLFYDRARVADPDFAVTDRNAHVLAKICHRLDGIPLAVELAAACTGVLGLDQILSRLDDRFRLLTSGSRSSPERHQTLRATVDWSYNLLDALERRLLRRLSIFAGGATLDAAEGLDARMQDGTGDEVPAVLRLLVAKSLVVVDRRFEEPRYRFLETIRDYARERLRLAGEEVVAADAHRDLMLDLAGRAHARFGSHDESVWMDRLEAEHDNLRAAIRWSVNGGGAEGLEFCRLLGDFWATRGYAAEARAWLAAALAASPEGAGRLRAEAMEATKMCHFDYSGQLAQLEAARRLWRELGDDAALTRNQQLIASALTNMGEYAAAAAIHRENLEIHRRNDNPAGIALSLFGLGFIAMSSGDPHGAAPLFEESLQRYRALGDRRREGNLLHNLGEVALLTGDHDRAEALFGQAIDVATAIGYRVLDARTRHMLGYNALDRGDAAAARAWFEQALALDRETGDDEGIAYALAGLASVAALEGDAVRAMRLEGAAQAIREAIRIVPTVIETEKLERRLDLARQALGPAIARGALDEGRHMGASVAIDYALGVG